MAQVALDPSYRRVSVEEFPDMDFGGAKAELDATSEPIRVVRRIHGDDWADTWLPVGSDLPLPSLGVTVPHAEILARD